MYKMVKKRKQLVPVRDAPKVPTPKKKVPKMPDMKAIQKKVAEKAKPKAKAPAKPKAKAPAKPKAKAPAKPKAKAPAKAKPKINMARIQKKVAKLGKDQVKAKKKQGTALEKAAKKEPSAYVNPAKLDIQQLNLDNPHLFEEHDEIDNYFQSMAMRGDYTDFLTQGQSNFYGKHYVDAHSSYGNAIEYQEDADKFEDIEQKLMNRVSTNVYKTRAAAVRAFKKKEKGTKKTLSQYQQAFASFYDNY